LVGVGRKETGDPLDPRPLPPPPNDDPPRSCSNAVVARPNDNDVLPGVEREVLLWRLGLRRPNNSDGDGERFDTRVPPKLRAEEVDTERTKNKTNNSKADDAAATLVLRNGIVDRLRA